MLCRSAAETQKLELLSEFSGVKLRNAALEKDNMEVRAQMKRNEQDMAALVNQCYTLCGASLSPGMTRKDIIENLLQIRSPVSSTSSSPQRSAGTMAASGELPRRVLVFFFFWK